jgi:integrase
MWATPVRRHVVDTLPLRRPLCPREHAHKEQGAWRAALKRAGLQFRFHDLRHTCITKLAESQASEQTLMAIAGHVSRKMIEHYSHIRMEAKRTAVDAIATQQSKTSIEAGVNQNVHQQAGSDSKRFSKSLN